MMSHIDVRAAVPPLEGAVSVRGWVVPHGASGHPGSAHYTDQQTAWVDGTLLPFVVDWEQLAREAETTLRLEPRTSVGSSCEAG